MVRICLLELLCTGHNPSVRVIQAAEMFPESQIVAADIKPLPPRYVHPSVSSRFEPDTSLTFLVLFLRT